MLYQVMADDNEINATNVASWIQTFCAYILPIRQKLGDYYDGKNKISKQGAVSGRPNYSINVNMAKCIVDVATGYTFGVPITYSTSDEKTKSILEKLEYINKNCNASEVDFQQGGDMSTFGISYQLIMPIEGNESLEDRIRFEYLSPLQTFYVTKNDISKTPLCAVYFYTYTINNTTKTKIYVYDDTFLYIFEGSESNIALTDDGPQPHNMGYIPIIQSLNNDDAFGDFQQVTDLLDSLSLVISNNTDDLQSIANAILAISGGTLNKEQIDMINKERAANLPVGAKMEWIIKNINTQASQSHIDNVLKFIFQISQIPDLTDDAFGGNQSGVAMRYKLWGLDQLWVTKTTKYKKSIFQRNKILLRLLQYPIKSDVALLDNIEIGFTRNLPQDNAEIVQTVQNLKDITSDRTLLTMLQKYGIIEDVEKEMEELDIQAQKKADLYGFNNNSDLNNSQGEDEQ